MNSRQRRRLRRLSERMFKLCDLTRLRIAQDLDKFCSICTEAARRDSDKGGSPLPEHMLKENGERPTGRDSIMANVVKAIHKAAADAGRFTIPYIEVTATISRTPAPDEVG